MSVGALAWAWHQQTTPTQKLVLLALANFADEEGRCWPNYRTIVGMTGLSDRAVRKAISDMGLLVRKDPRVKEGRQTSNAYRLSMAPRATHPAPDATLGGQEIPPTGAPGATHEPSSEPSEEPSKTSARRRSRPRDLLFDQLALLEGIDPYQPVPKERAAYIGKIKRQILTYTPGCTEAELRRRSLNWRVLWPGTEPPTFTIGALAKWWPRLDHPENERPKRLSGDDIRRRHGIDGGRQDPGTARGRVSDPDERGDRPPLRAVPDGTGDRRR